MDIQRDEVKRDPQTGSVDSLHTQQHVDSQASTDVKKATRAGSYVWYVIAVIEVLLFARLLFLLLGANNTGFASLLYQVTLPFMFLFKGIFPAPGSITGYFETATVLAMVVYALIGWGIVSLIDINKEGKSA